MSINQCDGGHETNRDVKVLPLSDEPMHGNLILCFVCFQKEMTFRKERNRKEFPPRWEGSKLIKNPSAFDVPLWNDLEVYRVE